MIHRGMNEPAVREEEGLSSSKLTFGAALKKKRAKMTEDDTGSCEARIPSALMTEL